SAARASGLRDATAELSASPSREIMMRKLMMMAAAAATLGMAIGPGGAPAQRYYDHVHHRYYWRCRAARNRDTTTGTVLGAIGGGLIGHAVGGRGAEPRRTRLEPQ